MENAIARLLDHYGTFTDGSSALLRPELVALCQEHSVSEAAFCDAFALELVRRFEDGRLDADGAAFAADDLHVAADFVLPPFARRIFDLLEYREASPDEARQVLERQGHGTAA